MSGKSRRTRKAAVSRESCGRRRRNGGGETGDREMHCSRIFQPRQKLARLPPNSSHPVETDGSNSRAAAAAAPPPLRIYFASFVVRNIPHIATFFHRLHAPADVTRPPRNSLSLSLFPFLYLSLSLSFRQEDNDIRPSDRIKRFSNYLALRLMRNIRGYDFPTSRTLVTQSAPLQTAR